MKDYSSLEAVFKSGHRVINQISGLEYEEASNGIRIEGDEEYFVDLTSENVEVSKEAENQGFMNARQSLGSADSLEEFKEILEEVE